MAWNNHEKACWQKGRNNKAETWAMLWRRTWAAQSLTVSSPAPSKRLIGKLLSLWYIESYCCLEIRSIGEKICQNSLLASQKNGVSLLFIQQQHVCCLILHFDRKLELCQQQNVAELIYFVCLAVNATEGSPGAGGTSFRPVRFLECSLILQNQGTTQNQ